ncbi:MAG TPA: chorismate mutase [Pyrinomonadaceae bacterium]|jgi:chorismate mutase/prephenate dehydratase
MKLEDWRKEIDAVDAKLVELIARRLEIARKIGVLKAATGLPVVDRKREAEVLRRAARRGRGASGSEAVVGVFRAVLRESRIVQTEILSKIGAGETVS